MSSKYNRVPVSEDDHFHIRKEPGGLFQLTSRKIIMMILIAVVIFVYTLMRAPSKHSYSVVIDAGSTGSRVHVYEFEKTDNDIKVVDELFAHLKPGLSSYGADAAGAAKSLVPLLNKALAKVPKSMQKVTPIALGATAGLRMLPGTQADDILKAVEKLIRTTTPFVLEKSSDIRVLGGNDEGKFAWVAVNLLLGQTGLAAKDTSPVCDLGGGSVQCMFARTDSNLRAGTRSKLESYLETVSVQDRTYSLYVHSYLGYGMMAGRFKVLSGEGNAGVCMPKGYADSFTYNGKTASWEAGKGAGFDLCTAEVSTILHLGDGCEVDGECGFNGAWGGGLRTALEKESSKPHLLSYIYDRLKLVHAGRFDPGTVGGKSSLQSLSTIGRHVCKMSVDELRSKIADANDVTFSHEVHISDKDVPYLCLDLAYINGLLRYGIGVPPQHSFNMDKKINSDGKLYEAAWTLGMALEIM